MKYPVYIFGETDYETERNDIDRQISALHQENKIFYILSEEIGSNIALQPETSKRYIQEGRYSTSKSTYNLAINLGIPAIGIDNHDKKTYARDTKNFEGEVVECVRSSSIRENRMVDTISRYASLGGCAVIVNNDHLRVSANSKFGGVSPIIHRLLCNNNVFIKSDAVKDKIVDVHGTCFNKNIYTRLIKLSNELTTELADQGKKKSNFFDLGDFLGDNVHTYCYHNGNTIVSILTFTVNQNNTVNVELFYTAPEHRNKGYGTKLFTHLFDNYPKETHAFYVGPITNGSSTISLYKKLGFNEVYTTLKL